MIRGLPIAVMLALAGMAAATYDQADPCEHFGPQAPRDILSRKGKNKVNFPFAPRYEDMNLCNIHFHATAEHKASGYPIEAKPVTHDDGETSYGYLCTPPRKKYLSTHKAPKDVCQGTKVGDTIEVHWVFTSCDVPPGPGLGSCSNEICSNPVLRVEAAVFVVVNHKSGLEMADYDVYKTHNYPRYQPKRSLPSKSEPIQYLGSTTGTSFTGSTCSPFQVTWGVRQECFMMDIYSLGHWCRDNIFEEDHGHGSRQLVTNKKLLSELENTKNFNKLAYAPVLTFSISSSEIKRLKSVRTVLLLLEPLALSHDPQHWRI